VNTFKASPGMVYITLLVIIVCSIPFLPGVRRAHPLSVWPTSGAEPHHITSD
jgi:hypothetical protein